MHCLKSRGEAVVPEKGHFLRFGPRKGEGSAVHEVGSARSLQSFPPRPASPDAPIQASLSVLDPLSSRARCPTGARLSQSTPSAALLPRSAYIRPPAPRIGAPAPSSPPSSPSRPAGAVSRPSLPARSCPALCVRACLSARLCLSSPLDACACRGGRVRVLACLGEELSLGLRASSAGKCV